MVTRQDFDPGEWQLLCEAPTYAGLIVATAQPGGFLWEALSITRTLAEVGAERGQSRVLEEICAARPHVEHTRFRTRAAMREYGLERIRAAVKLVALKGSPADLDAYARLLVAVAERVAQVYPETGEPVTAAERAALAEVTAAAGLTPRRYDARARTLSSAFDAREREGMSR